MDQITNTLTASLTDTLAAQKAAFAAAPCPSAAARREKLVKLEALLKRDQARIADAIAADFGRPSPPRRMPARIWPDGCGPGGARSA
jgi:coniferyl-aldehyde dehydrogenase